MIPQFCNLEKWKETNDGIYICEDEKPNTAFVEETQDKLFELEDNSWWFQYRSKIILSMMDRYFTKNSFTLDIGAGNGYTSACAARSGYMMGIIEPSISACRHAKMRGLSPILCGTVTEDSILDNTIDQALMLDCLEHIEDDNSMLKMLAKKIRRGGILLITVPAFMSLWSSEDDSAGHYRRYTRTELEKKVTTSGFKVLQSSYFMSFLYIPILLVRVWMERLGFIKRSFERSNEEQDRISQRQFIAQGKLTNSVLNWLEHIEQQKLEKSSKICFGSSIILVALKVTDCGNRASGDF